MLGYFKVTGQSQGTLRLSLREVAIKSTAKIILKKKNIFFSQTSYHTSDMPMPKNSTMCFVIPCLRAGISPTCRLTPF